MTAVGEALGIPEDLPPGDSGWLLLELTTWSAMALLSTLLSVC